MHKFILAILAAGWTTTAHAQPMVIADSGDSGWVLAASALVMIAALPGLALVHGRGRAGPAGLALFMTAAIVSLLFAAIGYSLAFGEGSALLGGVGNAMLGGLADLHADSTIPDSLFVLFQLVVALFATGLLAASISESARPGWLFGFVGLWFLIVYVPVARWLWGGGWLAGLGAIDFGGGLVVQASSGTAAFVVALLLGRGGTEIAQDSRLALTGMALVWIGMFGLIGGATLAAGDDAASVILNVQLAASGAALTGLILERWRTGSITVYGPSTAAIAGIAAVSAGALYLGPAGAMVIGVIGAIASRLAAALCAQLRLGGAAAAFVMHGGGGIAGALVFPLLAGPIFGGAGFDAGVTLTNQLIAQAVATGVVVLWTAVATTIAALMVSVVLPMRERA